MATSVFITVITVFTIGAVIMGSSTLLLSPNFGTGTSTTTARSSNTSTIQPTSVTFQAATLSTTSENTSSDLASSTALTSSTSLSSSVTSVVATIENSSTTQISTSTSVSSSVSNTTSPVVSCGNYIHYLVPSDRNLEGNWPGYGLTYGQGYGGIWNFTTTSNTQGFEVFGSFSSSVNYYLTIGWSNTTYDPVSVYEGNLSIPVFVRLNATLQPNGNYTLNLAQFVPMNPQNKDLFEVRIQYMNPADYNSTIIWTTSDFNIDSCQGVSQLAFFTEQV
ncbi:MAG: hypothetical protein ACYCQJ_02480 [Nitrososphaerales archaeon]